MLLPSASQSESRLQAQVDKRLFNDAVAPASTGLGVKSGCLVSAQGTPNMTVAVSSGTVVSNWRSVGVAAGNVTISSNTSGNPRIDLICVDATGAKSVVAGTPAAIPNTAWPDPAGKVVIATIYVPDAAASITNARITDTRVIVAPPTADQITVRKPAGVADWAPTTVFPSSTYGWGGVSGYAFVNESAYDTLNGSPGWEYLVYKSGHEIADGGETGSTNPEKDLGSDASRSVLTKASIVALIGAGILPASVILEASGVDIVDSFSCNLADLSNPNLQKCHAQALISFAWRNGVKRIFMDTYNDTIIGTGNLGVLPDGVQSERDWEERYAMPYARNVFRAVRRAGIQIYVNGGGSVDSYNNIGGSENRGDATLRWWYRLRNEVDGFCHEYAFEGADSDPFDDSIHVTGAAANSFRSWLRYYMRLPAFCQYENKGYVQFVVSWQGYTTGTNGANSTTINIDPTYTTTLAKWPTAGTVYINGETITYTGKGTNSITGCSPHLSIVSGSLINHNDGRALRLARAAALMKWTKPNVPLVTIDFRQIGNIDTDVTWLWDTGLPIGLHKTALNSYAHTKDFEKGRLLMNAQYTGNLTIDGVVVGPRDAFLKPW